MKYKKLIAIAIFGLLLLSQSALKALDDTLWCKYTYPNVIYAVKFTPDGKYLAAGGSDGVVTIYNALTGDTVKSYKNSGGVYGIDFNSDGSLIAISNAMSGMKVYNFQTDSLLTTKYGVGEKFSKDGKYLINNGNIFDVQTWQSVGTFPNYANYPNGEETEYIDISADNQYIVTGAYMYKESKDTSNIIRLYQLNNLHVVNEYILDIGLGGFPNVCFSPDGKYLAETSKDDTIRIWTLSDRTIYKKICHYNEVDAIAFSPDGNYIIDGGGEFKDLTLKIWDIDLKSIVYTYPVYTIFKGGGALSISINKDKTLIGVGGGAGIYMYNAKWNPVSVEENKIIITNNTIYPNPTNNIVNIEFTLLKNEQTKIYIYDNNSNLISTIFNGLLTTGKQEFQWNTDNVINGIYYCQINVNNSISTIKIIVNK